MPRSTTGAAYVGTIWLSTHRTTLYFYLHQYFSTISHFFTVSFDETNFTKQVDKHTGRILDGDAVEFATAD
jgi:hypothetical protein